MTPPLDPTTADTGTDLRVFERIRALLAKAESSEFPSEAEAFSAKAEQLMARHSIDVALIGDAAGAGPDPGSVELGVDNPYAANKFQLLSRVADANRCRAIYNQHTRVATVVGFATERAFVEALYTSLLVQGSAEVGRAGSVIDHWGVNRTRSYRNAFWAGFAHRVGARLVATAGAATAAAGADVLPVLARRVELVDEAVHRRFPHLRRLRNSVTNADGWLAGDAAGARADLGGRGQVRS